MTQLQYDIQTPTRRSFENLPRIPGGWQTKRLTVAEVMFRLTMPADPDAFLEDPDVLAAHDRDDYMPYWSYLWPAALKMAETVIRSNWRTGTQVLEIGAGIGLVGLAALSRGLAVTLSDYEQAAVDVAVHNARQNGFADARGMCLDWRCPKIEQFPMIFGCDVLYESRNHQPILDLVAEMLAPDGVCWIGDGGRQHAGSFIELARDGGFDVTLRDGRGRIFDKAQSGRFQIVVLKHP